MKLLGKPPDMCLRATAKKIAIDYVRLVTRGRHFACKRAKQALHWIPEIDDDHAAPGESREVWDTWTRRYDACLGAMGRE